ncbi:FxsA family protein [Bdellovibrio svalbardensis]|uniref:FxsA family protein n=1 Tax=Bdellovibrio svalbardensis TaxID=2972972 RepID=A0ABT6DEK3_9BACT|nr:FxsA family protein [Bdellovibrio svalbardensis]MDG0815257.1 FxsA family protein [Bdellovibrio svalbardensis]
MIIPFPFIIAEVVIFFLGVNQWGFFNTLGLYLLPCILGFIIVSTVGRMAIMTLQSTVTQGQLPANKILHSGAIFLSGIFFLIPSFFTRIIGVILLLPGLRHLAVWRFKLFMAKQIKKGAASFNFGGNGFGFGGMGGMGGMGRGGPQGFRYYEFRNDGTGFQDVSEVREEREIQAEVVDVTPLEITHEEKKPKED